jgi:AraC-like DNA-binding protein
LAPLVVDLDAAVMRLIPRHTPALGLLAAYVSSIVEDPTVVAPELRRLAVTHVYDLAAMIVGATRDAAEIGEGRGVRAARLGAIKADIRSNLVDCELRLTGVAVRLGVTPRYIDKLFESEGTTYTEFVLGERLAHAHRTLTEPRFAGKTISSVAYDAGFGDLSYFNRVFRRRYGATPSEVRAAADRR